MNKCKYCNKDNFAEIPSTHANDLNYDAEVIIDENSKLSVETDCDDSYYSDTIEVKINFCPMCGRKLEKRSL